MQEAIEIINKPDFGYLGGVKVPIIWRKKGNTTTDRCPFCKKKHNHGRSEGHRIQHCNRSSSDAPIQITLSDGDVVNNDHGYILCDY